MRCWLPLLLFLACFANGAFGSEFKIATWNIAWLNADTHTGKVKRTTNDYQRLAKYAELLDADVISLQEVDGSEAARRIFVPDTYDFYFEDRNTVQRVGIAVRKRADVAFVSKNDVEELDTSGRLRRGVSLVLELDGIEVRFLAVHLKSGCFEHDLQVPQGSDCLALTSQIEPLENWIDQNAAEGKPLVVFGDFNRRMDIEGDDLWDEIDDGHPTGLDLVRVNAGIRPPCWNHQYDEFIDHIVVDSRAQKLVLPETVEQLVYDQADAQFKDVLSDHCPLSVILSTR